MSLGKLNVLLFCGGRGSRTLINELLRRSDVSLTLLVNAYDDGLSTGALRKFIPGMLGPSDFRKNYSYLLNLHSPEQYALQKLFEYRFPVETAKADFDGLKKFIESGDVGDLVPPLSSLFEELSSSKIKALCSYLRTFLEYYESHNGAELFDFGDCSMGNLVFAGIYIDVGQNFNRTIEVLGHLTDSRAHMINASKGENYTLIGLKADGQILVNEGTLVNKQSSVPIQDTFFIKSPPEAGWENLQAKSQDEKLAWLRANEAHAQISDEATRALQEADVIIYGTGTQHSSLLPSYRIAHQQIKDSPAKLKVFLVNLNHDHDIQGLSAPDLVDKALFYLKDEANQANTITHILYHQNPQPKEGISFPENLLITGSYKGAKIVSGNYVNPVNPNVHNGFMTIKTILDLVSENGGRGKPALTLYLDLQKRAIAGNAVIQEAIELPWENLFSTVTIHIPEAALGDIPKLPPYLKILPWKGDKELIESEPLLQWLAREEKLEYLATLTGDGEYLLKDVLSAVYYLKNNSFGIVHGSRTQSRRQFLTSLRSTYGEGPLLHRLSWLGAFVLTMIFGLRFGVIFSDPLTGFRVYRRDRIPQGILSTLRNRKLTPVVLTRHFLSAGVEISEIPVSYRTFSGFTSFWWRLSRGLKSFLRFFH